MPVLKAKYNGEWINVSGGGTGGGSSVQSDWNQNDSTQLDYIKNRTHYDEGQPYEISIFNQENMNFVEEPNMNGTGTMNIYTPESYEEEMALENLQFIAGNTYTIIIDGTSYSAQAKNLGGPGSYIGNLSLAIPIYPSTNENFLIIPSEGMFVINDSNSSHNITITEIRSVIEKEIVSQNTYSFSLNSDIMYLNITDFDFSSLNDGDLLIVNYNGKEYSCNVTAIDGLGLIFGNGSMTGFPDTEWNNEPFTGIYTQGMSGIQVYPTAIPFRIEKIISDTETEIIVPENAPYSTYIDDGISYEFSDPSSFVIEPETSYKIFWNNIEYIGTSSTASDWGEIILEPDSEGDIPFAFIYCNNENELYAYFAVLSGGPEILNEQIQISGLSSGVKKLDKKYIPNDIDLPIASYDKVGVVKVYDAWSGVGRRSDYTPIYLDTDDNQIYARKPDIPVIQKSTTDLTEGVSSLASGAIYLVYE